MKKLILTFLILIASFVFSGCASRLEVEYPPMSLSYQKPIARISNYDRYFPASYELMDYQEKALTFHQWLFDTEATGDFLPLITKDDTRNEFRFGAYVGDDRGYVEGVAAIAAVLSASLLGLDMTDYDGDDYVAKLSQFYNANQRVILNGTRGVSIDSSLWYMIYPGILFTQVSALYPGATVVREQALSNIEQWYQAHLVFQAQEKGPDYNFTSFDFTTMQPYNNGIWQEPDSAVGIGMLMYYGYQWTGEEKYLDALINTMDYISNYFSSPLYEILHYYAPFLGAYLNAQHGKNYDLSQFLNENFDGLSVPRGGWGSVVGTWGEFPMDGLMGSTRDRGGYAFSMNTFASAFIVSSFVSYDARYASATGQWLLHLTSNGRYFFSDQSDPRFHSCTYFEQCGTFNEVTGHSVPYEGIINGYNGRTPWIGGDPMITGWANTDLSIYSGVSTGMLGVMIEPTDVEGLLKIWINRMAMLGHDPFPQYLLFNPHPEVKTVTYLPSTEGPLDLYDLVSKTYLSKNHTGALSLDLGVLESVIVVELPVGTQLIVDDLTLRLENGHVLTQFQVHTGVSNLTPNQTVSGPTRLEWDYYSDVENDAIQSITVRIGTQTFTSSDTNSVLIDLTNLGLKGNRRFSYEITMVSGLKDTGSIILTIE